MPRHTFPSDSRNGLCPLSPYLRPRSWNITRQISNKFQFASCPSYSRSNFSFPSRVYVITRTVPHSSGTQPISHVPGHQFLELVAILSENNFHPMNPPSDRQIHKCKGISHEIRSRALTQQTIKRIKRRFELFQRIVRGKEEREKCVSKWACMGAYVICVKKKSEF